MASSPSRLPSGAARTLTVGVAALALLSLAACSSDDPVTARAADASSAPPQPPSTPAETDESPSATTGAAEPTSAPDGPVLGRRSRDLRDRMLSAAELPPAAPRSSWRGTGVSTAEQEEFARCHPFSLTGIGAERVRLRSFADEGSTADSDPAEAGHLLAQFPDRATVRRVSAVLSSWHEQCEDRLAGDVRRVRVGDVVTVDRLAGPAWWYRTKVKERRGVPAVIEVTGTVSVGNHVAVVVFRHVKGSYGPSLGSARIEETLSRAAAALA